MADRSISDIIESMQQVARTSPLGQKVSRFDAQEGELRDTKRKLDQYQHNYAELEKLSEGLRVQAKQAAYSLDRYNRLKLLVIKAVEDSPFMNSVARSTLFKFFSEGETLPVINQEGE